MTIFTVASESFTVGIDLLTVGALVAGMADVHGLDVLCDVDLLAGVAAHAALPLTAGYPDHQPLDLRLDIHMWPWK